ncbi:MAG TPA: hypothetical protein VKU60_14075 [Chloroflexota bacterium]|nr:hypothetical protein [Chloroflexota bacterium]
MSDGSITRGQCDRCGGVGDPLLAQLQPGLVRITGWRCYGCRHWPAGHYYVYVVDLNERAGPRAVYVGQSALYPAERFSQHLTAYKAASVVHRFGERLRPDLFLKLNPIRTRADAEAMEARLAETLRRQGYRVYGGH